jgi:formylglycine-generating enzyme required for sulfatase activity
MGNNSTIDLRHKNIDDQTLQTIINKLNNDPTVRSINLNFNQISEAGTKILADFLKTNNNITNIYLEHNPIFLSNKISDSLDLLRNQLWQNKQIHELKEYFTLYSYLRSALPKDEAQYVFSHFFSLHQTSDLPAFVAIPGGNYKVGALPNIREGCPNNTAALHFAKLKDFSISETAITEENFYDVMRIKPFLRRKKADCPLSFMIRIVDGRRDKICANLPINAPLEKIKEYIKRLNKRDPVYKYRLPTGNELEVAFRGDSEALYATGRNDEIGLRNIDWYKVPGQEPRTHPVKSVQHNNLGIYRSSVSEWAKDKYYDCSIYQHDARKFPVAVGGSEFFPANGCLLAKRHQLTAESHNPFLGFRLVREQRKSKSKSNWRKYF